MTRTPRTAPTPRTPRTPRTERIAGAPISWGVCEVPGWGHQLPPGRVLREMRALGLSATEFGPDGYLPGDTALLKHHGLTAAGGFVPVVLHDRDTDPVRDVNRALDSFAGQEPERAVLVLAAATGRDGYEGRPDLDEANWDTLLANLDRLAAHARGRGFTATLHPHVGTMVETRDEVRRVLDASEIAICLDTGHLLIGGTDPADLARQAADRIGHVHLKDVRQRVAARVAGHEIGYAEGVRTGLYQPLGHGDVDVAGVIAALTAAGYQGWYVLEQDTILADGTADPAAQVLMSLDYLRGLL